MEFRIEDLAVMASDINYYPALGVAVNKLLSARSSYEYEIALKEATKIAIGYENINIRDAKDYGNSTLLPGMPLWQPLLLKGEDGQDDLLLESAVVELTRTKNIVITEVQGRDTSVDEWINNGDWRIEVSGLLATNEPRYPMDEVSELQSFMDRNNAITVEQELLNGIGVYDIVVLGQKLAKTPQWNIQKYSFSAKATEPLPLIVELQKESEII